MPNIRTERVQSGILDLRFHPVLRLTFSFPDASRLGDIWVP